MRHLILLGLGLAAVSGCDVLLGMTHVSPAPTPDVGPPPPDGSIACEGPVGDDEDGDGVRDAADVCPGIAFATADGDLDGVGDACDPRPTLPDRLLLFDGFHGSVMAPWTLDDCWRPCADGVSCARGSTDLLPHAVIYSQPLPGVIEVAVGYSVERVMPGTQTTTFAIVLAGGVEEQVCQVSKDGLTARVGATSSASASLADPSQARAGAHGRLVATLTPTHLRCDLVDAHPLNISTLRSPGAPAQIRIETVGLDASIAYVGAWD